MELTLFNEFHTRLLRPSDLLALQALFERAGDYFELVTGRPPARDEAERAFVAGPPQKSVNDKRVIGLFTDADVLVGVLDAITDWPEPGCWSMGGLILDPAFRGRGLGRAVLTAYERWAADEGAERFRTAVVGHHGRGIRFLEHAGYRRVLGGETGVPRTAVFFEKGRFPLGKSLS
jgi:GNAT superfamily N-acetyltransferase